MATYFIHDDKNLHGPFTFEEMKDKELKKDTPVWTEGLDNWVTAAEIPDLKPLLAVVPPPFVQYPNKPKPPAFVQSQPVQGQVPSFEVTETVTPYDEYAYQSEMEEYFPTKNNWKTPLIAAGILIVFALVGWAVLGDSQEVPPAKAPEQISNQFENKDGAKQELATQKGE